MKPEHIPIVFRCLLEKCVLDLQEAATRLLGHVQDDEGINVQLSASSLAQGSQLTLENVQRIRCT